jgi:aspartate aminotransferase
VQSQTTTSAASVSQYAALAALQGSSDSVEQMRQAFERRRDLVVSGLNAIEGIRCRLPEGAFYAFFDVRGLYGRTVCGKLLSDDLTVSELLLDEAHCGLVPGSAFFAPGYVRMSYAASDAQLREGLSRMARVLGGRTP